MKKLVVLGVFFIGVFIFFNNKPGAIIPIQSNTPSPTPINTPGVEFLFKDVLYRVQFIKVNPKDVNFYSNLSDKKSSIQLKQDRNCKAVVNGGFYSVDYKPLGLVISEGNTESEYRNNSLFNGIFGINFADKVFIENSYPKGDTRLAIQSGPVLIKNKVAQKLQLKNDEFARRTIVGLTNNKQEVYFFSVYKDGSMFEGPMLSQLPEFMQLFSKQIQIEIDDALNLDGGSASAFLSESASIREANTIGFYFCVKAL